MSPEPDLDAFLLDDDFDLLPPAEASNGNGTDVRMSWALAA